MASMAFGGCTPAPSSEIALSSAISPILQTATETLARLTASGGRIISTSIASDEAEILCAWGDAEPISYSIVHRSSLPILQESDEIGVLLDDEARRMAAL